MQISADSTKHELLTVGLDLRALSPEFKAHFGRGTGRYVEELVKQLFALVATDSQFAFSLRELTAESLKGARVTEIFLRLLPAGRTTVEQQFFLPQRLSKSGVDLLHFFAHGDAPSRLAVPYVVTVLDLIPLKFPDLYQAAKNNWRYKFARFLELHALRQALGIIAISEATKKDLVNLLGIAPERIQVTPLAASNKFKPRELNREYFKHQLQNMRAAVNLPAERDLLLYVGGIDQRKNVFFLLELLRELKARRQQEHQCPLLAMVGRYKDDEHYPELCRRIEAYGLQHDVLLLGFLADEQHLHQMLHAASLLLFPSLYEGFGLPVLEAMASGVPVLAGDNSSLPEVTGELPVLLPDNNLALWRDRVEQILGSIDLQCELAALGLAQAKRFSWEKTARLTLESYQYFLQQKKIS